MSEIVPVILSGGMGTRLWPLSRTDRPKQFSRLVGEESLLQQTVSRLAGLHAAEPVVVCNQSHGATVRQQLAELSTAPQAILLEPEGRNTAPAVAAAAAYLLHTAPSPEQVMLVLPADHVIPNADAFIAAAQAAAEAAAAGYLVTFGVVPRGPETGYGYLKRGDARHGCFAVDQFVEKPDSMTAQSYIASGQYLWNSGMFAFTPQAFLDELRRLQPDMTHQVERSVAAAAVREGFVHLDRDAFLACRSDSIDYAVMEKTDKAVLVPLDAGWSDVGSWSAVAELGQTDPDGNSSVGDVLIHGCANSHFQSSGRLIAAVGVRDHIVVETPDAVLVVHRDQAQDVKALVDKLRSQSRSELRDSTDEEDREP